MRRTQIILGAASLVCGLSMTVSVATQQPAAALAKSDPPFAAPAPSPAPPAGHNYVGSQACRRCHMATYERWAKTRMANVVLDPKTHRDAVLGDFSKADPAVAFKLDDVALIYGSKWKQRYFRKVGDDFYPLGGQWDVRHRQWRPYLVQPNTDWWVPHYPATNDARPTGPLCDGCHSVNYNLQTKAPTEWNVGCERCHGPGGEHIRQPSTANIVNPAKLDFVHANDTCIQCHSQGQPLTNPILGKYYDWPVGFHQGGSLREYWRLEEHKIGETTFTHYADGTAHKNRMQGNDFVQSVMYRRGVTCFSCHDVHGTGNDADLIKPARDLCLTCHGPSSPNGPHNVATIEQHTHHQRGSAGSECIACHMPQIEQTIADVNVRSHTFAFITPSMTTHSRWRIRAPGATRTSRPNGRRLRCGAGRTCRHGARNEWNLSVEVDDGDREVCMVSIRFGLLAALCVASAVTVLGQNMTVSFDKDSLGQPPAGWTATKTGTGDARWTIEKDSTAPSGPNVLKQSGVATYPVCFKDDTSLKDGFVEVKFKPVSGKEDQAGGVMWRLKDANNYYIARANALEDNVTIYDTVNGRRSERKRASMKVTSNVWHTLRVDFQGSHFTVAFDGKKALEWDDEKFKEAGKVGVWTKADSLTLFDDFSYGGK